MTTVPATDEEGDSGEETTFGNTQCSTAGHETSIVLGDTQKSSADGPSDHDARNPERWAKALHGHVGGDLGSNIEWKEYGEAVVVLKSLLIEVEILLQGVQAIATLC